MFADAIKLGHVNAIDWAIMVVMPLRWKSFWFSKDGLVLNVVWS